MVKVVDHHAHHLAFQIIKKSIEDATAEVGITIDEYMHFFHPDRNDNFDKLK